jgi:hypothetical protein
LEKLMRPVPMGDKLPTLNQSKDKGFNKGISVELSSDGKYSMNKGLRAPSDRSTEMSLVTSLSIKSGLMSLPQLYNKSSFKKLGSRLLGLGNGLKQDMEQFLLNPAVNIPLSITRKKFECPFTRITSVMMQTSHVGMYRTTNIC